MKEDNWVCAYDILDVSADWNSATGETAFFGSWHGIEPLYSETKPTAAQIEAWVAEHFSEEFCSVARTYRFNLNHDFPRHWNTERAAKLERLAIYTSSGVYDQALINVLRRELKPTTCENGAIGEVVEARQEWNRSRERLMHFPTLQQYCNASIEHFTEKLIRLILRSPSTWETRVLEEDLPAVHELLGYIKEYQPRAHRTLEAVLGRVKGDNMQTDSLREALVNALTRSLGSPQAHLVVKEDDGSYCDIPQAWINDISYTGSRHVVWMGRLEDYGEEAVADDIDYIVNEMIIPDLTGE